MYFQSRIGLTETAPKTTKRSVTADTVISRNRPAPAETLQFAARQTGGPSQDMTRQLGEVAKNEMVFTDNFYGFMPLNLIAATETELDPKRKTQTEAYADLLAYALRPKTMKAATVNELRHKLENPNPALAEIMRQFKVTAEDLKDPVVDVNRIDADNDIPPEVLTRMGKVGLFALKIPQEYGGVGLCQKSYSTMLGHFSRLTNSASLTSVLSAHSTIGSAPLQMFGTEEQKRKYFSKIAEGNFLVAFGLTEPRAGTDIQNLQTTATQQLDGSWKLNGEKLFITNTINAGLAYFVAGHTLNQDGVDIGPTTFIVELPFRVNESREEKERKIHELSKQGMSILPVSGDSGARLMVINGSNQAHIWFKDFTVPAGNILGNAGNGLMVPMQGLTKGRAGFGPMLAESSRWFALQSAAHLNDRMVTSMNRKLKKGAPKTPPPPAFGPRQKETMPLGDMEYPRTRLGDTATKAAMDRAVSELVAGLIDAYPDKGAAGLSAAIKVMASYDNWQNAMTALELHGGSGLFKGAPNQVERNFRDSWIPMIVEGVNAAMLQFMVAMGALPVSNAMLAPEAQKRLNKWGANVKEEIRLISQGKFAEAWEHHKATSLLTMSKPEYMGMMKAQGKFLASQFNFERGNLPLKEALWIQTRTREMALRFNWMGLRKGTAIIKNQNDVIRTAKVLLDILAVTAASVKLAKQGDTLPESERKALQTGIQEAKMRVDQEMTYIRLKGHPIEKMKAEVGALLMQEDKALRDAGQRPNGQDEYVDFLKKMNQRYQQRLAAKFSDAPAK